MLIKKKKDNSFREHPAFFFLYIEAFSVYFPSMVPTGGLRICFLIDLVTIFLAVNSAGSGRYLYVVYFGTFLYRNMKNQRIHHRCGIVYYKIYQFCPKTILLYFQKIRINSGRCVSLISQSVLYQSNSLGGCVYFLHSHIHNHAPGETAACFCVCCDLCGGLNYKTAVSLHDHIDLGFPLMMLWVVCLPPSPKSPLCTALPLQNT